MAIKKFGAAIRRAAGHGLAIGRRLVYERTILVLTAIFYVAVAATLWHFGKWEVWGSVSGCAYLLFAYVD